MARVRRKLYGSIVLAALIMLFAGSVFHADRAMALPMNGSDTMYFDENGEVVGERYVGCSGGNFHWGITTSVYSVDSWSCESGSWCIACYSGGFPTSCSETQCEVYGTSCSGVTCW